MAPNLHQNNSTESNKSNEFDWSSPYPTSMIVVISISIFIVSLITVFGNLLVLISFYIEKALRQPGNYFILSLAISDLLIGIEGYPIYTLYLLNGEKWPLGWFLCDLWLSIDYTVCLASIYTVLFITIDRFCSVRIPTAYRNWRTVRRVRIIIVLVWAVPTVLFFILIFGWSSFVYNGNRKLQEHQCWVQFMNDKFVNMSLYISYYWLTLIVMVVLYAGIYRTARNLHIRAEIKQRRLATITAMSGAANLGTLIGGPSLTNEETDEPTNVALCNLARERAKKVKKIDNRLHRNKSIISSDYCDLEGTDTDIELRLSITNVSESNKSKKIGRNLNGKNLQFTCCLYNWFKKCEETPQSYELIRSAVTTNSYTRRKISENYLDDGAKLPTRSNKEKFVSTSVLPNSQELKKSNNFLTSSTNFSGVPYVHIISPTIDSLTQHGRLLSDLNDISLDKPLINRISVNNDEKPGPLQTINSADLPKSMFRCEFNRHPQFIDQESVVDATSYSSIIFSSSSSSADSFSSFDCSKLVTYLPANYLDDDNESDNEFSSCSYATLNSEASSDIVSSTNRMVVHDLTVASQNDYSEQFDSLPLPNDSQPLSRHNTLSLKLKENKFSNKQQTNIVEETAPIGTIEDFSPLTPMLLKFSRLPNSQVSGDANHTSRIDQEQLKQANSTVTVFVSADTKSVPFIEQSIPNTVGANEVTCKTLETKSKRAVSKPSSYIPRIFSLWKTPSIQNHLQDSSLLRSLKKRTLAKPFTKSHFTKVSRSENRANKALRTITIILGAFIIFWTPFYILATLWSFCDTDKCFPAWLYQASYYMCYLNSSINPFCYAFANAHFKRTFLRIFRRNFARI